MKINYDHATLFVAPAVPAGLRGESGQASPVDDSAVAMRRLRHPFTLPAKLSASAGAAPAS